MSVPSWPRVSAIGSSGTLAALLMRLYAMKLGAASAM